MAFPHSLIHRSLAYSLLAVGVCLMPFANQYLRMAQFSHGGECRPVLACCGRLPGCRALPNEKNVSEALERSSRDPKQSGIAAASATLLIAATPLAPLGSIAHWPLEFANCTDQKLHWQWIRLLI